MRVHGALILAVLCGCLLASCTSVQPPPIAADDLTVYFGSRSADLVASEREKIDRVARALGQTREVTITIAGFAGTPGDPIQRMTRLALERTLVVRDALVTDLKRSDARRIRLAYRACGNRGGDRPVHRVDIFVTDGEIAVPDPCHTGRDFGPQSIGASFNPGN